MCLALFYVGKKQLQAKKLLIFLVENRNFSKALTYGFSQKLEPLKVFLFRHNRSKKCVWQYPI